MRYLKSNRIFDISTLDSVQYAWITCIVAYLSQEVVPGNNHRLVKGVVDRRREEADHSRLSLEAAATGPGGSENQRRVVVTLLVIVLNSATPIASIVKLILCFSYV